METSSTIVKSVFKKRSCWLYRSFDDINEIIIVLKKKTAETRILKICLINIGCLVKFVKVNIIIKRDAETVTWIIWGSKTPVFLYLPNGDGDLEFSWKDAATQRNLQVYHRSLCILSQEHSALAEFLTPQSKFQWLFHKNPPSPK